MFLQKNSFTIKKKDGKNELQYVEADDLPIYFLSTSTHMKLSYALFQ